MSSMHHRQLVNSAPLSAWLVFLPSSRDTVFETEKRTARFSSFFPHFFLPITDIN